MYDTRKFVGCKERLTRTLELLLLFASYTCLYITPSCTFVMHNMTPFAQRDAMPVTRPWKCTTSLQDDSDQ